MEGRREQVADSGESTENSSLAWLEEEAAHLQRGLLRDFARLAQVRLERQRSESLAKELDATVTRIESQEVKVAAELAARAAPKLQAANETQQAHPERGSARLFESVASLASSPNPPAQEQAARTPLADVACENGQQQAPPAAQPQSKQGHGILRVSTIAADGACARRSTVWVTAPTQLTERAAVVRDSNTERALVSGDAGCAPAATPAPAPAPAPAEGAQRQADVARREQQQQLLLAPHPSGKDPSGKDSASPAKRDGTHTQTPHTHTSGQGTLAAGTGPTPPTPTRKHNTAGEVLPNAEYVVGGGGVHKVMTCHSCQMVGHSQDECPKAFAERWPGFVMPGFSSDGVRDADYWKGQSEANGPNDKIRAAWLRHEWNPSLDFSKKAVLEKASGSRPGRGRAAAWSGWFSDLQGGGGGHSLPDCPVSGGSNACKKRALADGGASQPSSKCARNTLVTTSSSPQQNSAPGDLPTVSSITLLKHEDAQAIEWRQEEKVFALLARVAQRRPPGASGGAFGGGGVGHVFSNASAGISGSVLAAKTRALCECRKELAAACVRAGLAPLSERELGFVESARNRHLYSTLLSPQHLATNTTNATSLEPGFLELVEAAVAAGAVRVVEVDDVWYVQQADWAAAAATASEQQSSSSWAPRVFDVSLKFQVNMQLLPRQGGERVRESHLLFQIKVCEETPFAREVVHKPKKPPKEPANMQVKEAAVAAAAKQACGKDKNAEKKNFWLKARGLRVGYNRVYIRIGMQPKAPDTAERAGERPSKQAASAPGSSAAPPAPPASVTTSFTTSFTSAPSSSAAPLTTEATPATLPPPSSAPPPAAGSHRPATHAAGVCWGRWNNKALSIVIASVASVAADGAVVFKDTVQVASDEVVHRMKRSTSQGGETRQQRCRETLQQRLQKRLGCQGAGAGAGGYVYPPDWYMKCREAGVCFVSALGEECKEGDKCKYRHLSDKERRVWGVAPVSSAGTLLSQRSRVLDDVGGKKRREREGGGRHGSASGRGRGAEREGGRECERSTWRCC